MADLLVIALDIIQILLQLGAAWFAYRIIGLMGGSLFWILVVVAFLLQAVRRVTALALDAGVPTLTGELAFVDRTALPFLISVFLLLGMYELHRRLKKI